MNICGPGELAEDVLEAGLCIGCGACINLCPYFGTWRGKTAMLFACDKEQGRCQAFCPKTEVDLDALCLAANNAEYDGSSMGAFRQIFMSRAGSKAASGDFQDGGTVSALICFALETGQIDAAVLTGRKGLVPLPGLATRPDQVLEYSGSKYMASPTLSSLNKGVKKGYSRMGVVGTPCQMTAVAQMRANPMQDKKFSDPVALTVGLFCTWALDTRGLLALMEKLAPGEQIGKIRIPPPPAGVLVAETKHRSLEIPLDEIRELVPEGCRICPDMTAELADVSVGAMEGEEGWNTLVVRSQKGVKFVEGAAAAGYLVLDDFPETSLSHLKAAAGAKKKRAFDLACSQGRVNTKDGGRAALRVNTQALEKIISGPEGSNE
jgi:coenzyme F420 hydrogenase subunit beta